MEFLKQLFLFSQLGLAVTILSTFSLFIFPLLVVVLGHFWLEITSQHRFFLFLFK
jgi:hypothetical protein